MGTDMIIRSDVNKYMYVNEILCDIKNAYCPHYYIEIRFVIFAQVTAS